MDMGGLLMIYKSDIQIEADIARAEAADLEDDRGLNDVSEIIIKKFKTKGVYKIFMFYSDDPIRFGARVFYETNDQVAAAKKSGLNDEVCHAVYQALLQVGRSSATPENVDCEFDSHENVKKVCNGNYLTYLR